MCTMLCNKANQNNLTNPVTNNRVAICWINHCLYRGMLGTSITNWTHLKRAELSRAPGLAYLYAKDLTVYSVALPARWCIAQSNEGDWCVPARLHSALACMLNLYCLIYSYKIILNYLWYFVIMFRPDGVFRGRCLPARWCTAQSKGKRLMCPREATQALACMLNFYMLNI